MSIHNYLLQYMIYDLANIVMEYRYIDEYPSKRINLRHNIFDMCIYCDKIYCIKRPRQIIIYTINGEVEKIIVTDTDIKAITCTKNGIYVYSDYRKKIYVYSYDSYKLMETILLNGNSGWYYGVMCIDNSNIFIPCGNIVTKFTLTGKIEKNIINPPNILPYILIHDEKNLYEGDFYNNIIYVINKYTGTSQLIKIQETLPLDNATNYREIPKFIINKNIIIAAINYSKNIVLIDKISGQIINNFNTKFENIINKIQIFNNKLYVLDYNSILYIFE